MQCGHPNIYLGSFRADCAEMRIELGAATARVTESDSESEELQILGSLATAGIDYCELRYFVLCSTLIASRETYPFWLSRHPLACTGSVQCLFVVLFCPAARTIARNQSRGKRKGYLVDFVCEYWILSHSPWLLKSTTPSRLSPKTSFSVPVSFVYCGASNMIVSRRIHFSAASLKDDPRADNVRAPLVTICVPIQLQH